MPERKRSFILHYNGQYFLSKSGIMTTCSEKAVVFVSKEEADNAAASENARLKSNTVKVIPYKFIE